MFALVVRVWNSKYQIATANTDYRTFQFDDIVWWVTAHDKGRRCSTYIVKMFGAEEIEGFFEYKVVYC